MKVNLRRSSAALHDLTKSGLYAAVTLFVVFVSEPLNPPRDEHLLLSSLLSSPQ
jgi:hypothetical protein